MRGGSPGLKVKLDMEVARAALGGGLQTGRHACYSDSQRGWQDWIRRQPVGPAHTRRVTDSHGKAIYSRPPTGGEAPLMATIISAQTLVAMVSMPITMILRCLWLSSPRLYGIFCRWGFAD